MAHHHDAAGHASAEDEYLATPPGAGYEHTDASVWVIVRFAVWLVVSAVVIHIGLYVMFALFVESRELETAPEFPLAVGQGQRLPPEPRLQRFPANEAYDVRRGDDAALEGYGWVDQNAGTVHIPIEEAMKLTVERGLPSQASESTTIDSDLLPADSSSGRTMEKRRVPR